MVNLTVSSGAMRGLLGLLALPVPHAPPLQSTKLSVASSGPTSAIGISVPSSSVTSGSLSSSSPASISVRSLHDTPAVPRAAIPACLKTVELSCLNLAANCIDSVNSDTFNTLWGIKSCVVAATCYGVGDLITSVECQTGFTTTNAAQASLDYTSIYAGIVGDCAWTPGGCPITQQNYIDFYYGELSAINTANYPRQEFWLFTDLSSNSVVVSFWTVITAWAATGNSVPYQNFNDWLHFSSFPITTTTTDPPSPTYTQIEWNPNPVPSSGAESETFANSKSNVIIAIPSTTTVIVFGSASITLAPGGTPVGGPLPSDISMPGAVTPTWNPNIVPPVSAPSITFTAPPSFTTVVAVPTSSVSPPKNITGPPGDKNSNGDNWWLLLFGGVIGGLLPKDVGIPGGVTPTAAPPADWTGSWTDPDPASTSKSTPTSSNSASASSSSASPSCLPTYSGYSLSDDPENEDWDDLGTDPDRRRNSLEARDARNMKMASCGLSVTNVHPVNLKAGVYYSIGQNNGFSANAVLTDTNVGKRPPPNGAAAVNQEHVMEIGHIGQFLLWVRTNYPQVDCAWIENNVWNPTGWDGVTSWAQLLLNDIDVTMNMVWADKAMNQAKSNIVNNSRRTAANPPQKDNMDKIMNVRLSSSMQIQDVEYFIRNFAALGTYFKETSGVFKATALRVQTRLSQITPRTPELNLPVAFNRWLRELLPTYPTGCTDRVRYALEYYQARIRTVAAQSNTAIPGCLSVYHMGVTAQSFNWQDLVPAAPTLPPCNFPGTEGSMQTGAFQDGTPALLPGFRILAAGDTQYYGIGTGNSFGGSHLIAEDIRTQYPGCEWSLGAGVATGQSNLADAFVSMQCNGNTGSVTLPISFVVKNQVLHCTTVFSPAQPNGMAAAIYPLCATTASTATACANIIIQRLPLGSYIMTGGASIEFIPT